MLFSLINGRVLEEWINSLCSVALYVNIYYKVEYLRPYLLGLHLFYNLISPNKAVGLKKEKVKPQDNPLEEL